MSSNPRLDRRFGRALAIGLGLSLGVHAAVVALLRFEIPVLEETTRTVHFDPAPAPPPEAMQVVQLEGRLPDFGGGAPGESGGEGPALAATMRPAKMIDTNGMPLLPAIASDERDYDPLVVFDPLTDGAAIPVAITELPEAQTQVAAVPVWEPGAVGEAKRRWAREGGVGQAGGGAGTGTGWTIGGGDHCPVPGRGPRGY